MSILQIIIVLLIGIAMLVFGFIKKKKWLAALSIMPLAIVLWQFIVMFSM